MGCGSLWSLGGFLIFDSQRNQMNIQLGYLETKKVLGDFQGKWYTFFTAKEAEGSWRKFFELFDERRANRSILLVGPKILARFA